MCTLDQILTGVIGIGWRHFLASSIFRAFPYLFFYRVEYIIESRGVREPWKAGTSLMEKVTLSAWESQFPQTVLLNKITFLRTRKSRNLRVECQQDRFSYVSHFSASGCLLCFPLIFLCSFLEPMKYVGADLVSWYPFTFVNRCLSLPGLL